MTVSKQQFMNRPKIRSLPRLEKERRWKQYTMTQAAPRNSQRIRGRGDYFSDAKAYVDRQLKRLPKGSFASAGRFLGGSAGETAGSLLSKITGRGDYEIKKNSLIKDGNILRPGEMSFAPSGASAIRVQRREFLTDITSPDNPTEFHQQHFRLQCTDEHTFPWLAAISEHYSEWELHGAIISYESTSSNYSANMALGTIALATQYNANELPYNDMTEILGAAYNSRANPSQDLMHGIECDPALQASEHLFTRRFGTSGPPNLYDHGVVTVATQGLPAEPGTIVGRLYITYDVELNLPCLPTGGRNSGKAALLRNNVFSSVAPPMGAALDLISDDRAGLSFGTTAGDNILALQPSNGPWTRPQLQPAHQASLVGWMSDSSSMIGTQYLSFANPGTYTLDITLLTNATGGSSLSANMVEFELVTTEIEFVMPSIFVQPFPQVNPSGGTGNFYSPTWIYRATITTTASDQTLAILRQNSSTVTSQTTLTVCE